MKLFLVLTIFAIDACFASPIDYRWNLLADDEGRMHLIDAAPQEVFPEPFFNAESDTRFLLFTRSNPTVGQRITWTAASISASNFNSAHPTRVVIHGFNSGPGNSGSTGPTAAYLQRDNFNVIVCDWSVGASTINYVTARNRVPEVANVLARMLNFLVSNGSSSWNRINIAGHSLGAHIAGLTGKRTNGRIQVIFAMDPAGPLFALNEPQNRFAAGDAVYTEGIRTNAGNMGFAEPLAHADFYPNWGALQPGCGVDTAGTCSHSRAHALFTESINSNRFVGRRCANYGQITGRNCPAGQGTGIMGGDVWSSGLRGVYFFETNSNSPFARG